MPDPRGHRRILLVEDDPDAREALEMFLDGDGYEVTTAATAEDGLALLRARPCDLVITDFNLPGQTGKWLLDEAARENLLGPAGALLVSAQWDVLARDTPVLRKPLDLDRLLRAVHERIGESTHARVAAPALVDPDAAAVALVLYVTGGSIASARAVRNVERALAAYGPRDVHLEVVDVERDPSRGIADGVDFTPLLRRVRPLPKLGLLGDLRQAGALHDLLRASGLETPK